MSITCSFAWAIVLSTSHWRSLQYAANKMHSEALKTYDMIVSSRIYVSNGKLQANMGNVHFDMGNYEKAVKYYQMSLDKVGLWINQSINQSTFISDISP